MGKSYWDTEITYEQPTTKQLQSNAAETVRKARSKGKKLDPVIVTGRKLAKSWWGEAWCENLEKYADYASRLDRGKRYLKTGAVIDLKIRKGKVAAKVQGRRKTPYRIEIKISPINEANCQKVIEICGHQIESLELMLKGRFPEQLKDVFLGDGGLFPTPREISFSCSCPDWAIMCKHVAAVRYGVGVRFDENPLLFFELRGIDVNRFVDVTLENSVESMLKNADCHSDRIIENNDLEAIFGVL